MMMQCIIILQCWTHVKHFFVFMGTLRGFPGVNHHANQNTVLSAGHPDAGIRKHLRHDARARQRAGHPPAENCNPQPDAHESRNGDAASAAAEQHPAAGGRGAAAHGHPPVEKHARLLSQHVLQDVRRNQRGKIRRHDHHGRAGGEAAVRAGGLLAGAVPHPGVEPVQRLLHPTYLLGRAGGALLPLRHSEVPAPAQNLRHFPAPRPAPAAPAGARLRRQFLGAPFPLHRSPAGRHRKAPGTRNPDGVGRGGGPPGRVEKRAPDFRDRP